MSPLARLLIAAIAVLATTATAFEMATVRGEGMGGTLLLSQPSPLAETQCPSASWPERQFGFQSGYHRRFEMKELDCLFAAATFRQRWLGAGLSLSEFGQSDLYGEKTARLALTGYGNAFAIQVGWSQMWAEFGGGYSGLSASSLSAAAAVKLSCFHAAAHVDNLNSPRLMSHSPSFPPRTTLFTELQGGAAFSTTARVSLEKDAKPQFGMGQYITPASNVAVFLGWSSSPAKYGGGLSLRYGRSDITYAASYHPTLGLTHAVAVSVLTGAIPPEEQL